MVGEFLSSQTKNTDFIFSNVRNLSDTHLSYRTSSASLTHFTVSLLNYFHPLQSSLVHYDPVLLLHHHVIACLCCTWIQSFSISFLDDVTIVLLNFRAMYAVPCQEIPWSLAISKSEAFRTQISRAATKLTVSAHYKRSDVLAVQIKELHIQTVEPLQASCKLGLPWYLVARPWLCVLPWEWRKVNRQK